MSVSAERVAAGDAFEGEPAAFERAVFAHGFNGVLRTSGRVAAARRDKRADAELIKADKREKEFTEHGTFQAAYGDEWGNMAAGWENPSDEAECLQMRTRLTRD